MPKTAAQKAKRKLKRKAKKAAKRAAVASVLTGHGDYKRKGTKRKARGNLLGRVSNATGAKILRGKGDFLEDLGNGVANLAGNVARTGVGWLANKAKGWLGSLFGSGDYSSRATQMEMNSLWAHAPVSVVSESGKPNIFRMREALADIKSSNDFQLQSFDLNPGLAGSFPWLSVISRNFTQYRIHGAVLEYRKNCNQLQKGTEGRVLLSVRYDTSQPAPTDIAEVDNQAGTIPGVPYENMLMPIECKPSLVSANKLNLRSGALPPDQALQLYDHCILDVTNIGQDVTGGTIDIGTVYLAYDVELLNPVLASHNNPVTGICHVSAFACSTVDPDNNAAVRQADFDATFNSAFRKISMPTLDYDATYVLLYTGSGDSGAITSDTPGFTLTGFTQQEFFADTSGFSASPYILVSNTSNAWAAAMVVVAPADTACAVQFISPTMTALKNWCYDAVVIAVPDPVTFRSTRRDRRIWEQYNKNVRRLKDDMETETTTKFEREIEVFRRQLNAMKTQYQLGAVRQVVTDDDDDFKDLPTVKPNSASSKDRPRGRTP